MTDEIQNDNGLPMSFDFSIELEMIPVNITTPDGEKKTYELRELNGKQRDTYMSFIANRTKFNKDGKPVGLTDVTGLQSRILSMSLFDPVANKYIDEKTINDFPNRMLDQLVDAVSKMSRLSDDEDEKKKKGNEKETDGDA